MKVKPVWFDNIFFGYMMLFGLALSMSILYFIAFFHESSSVLISLNMFGEIRWEWILIIIAMVSGFIGLCRLVKIKKELGKT